MTSNDILKVTILCETKNGSYLAGVTDDNLFIRHAVSIIKFVEVDKEYVGNIDADKIIKKNINNTKETKLF